MINNDKNIIIFFIVVVIIIISYNQKSIDKAIYKLHLSILTAKTATY